MVQYRNTANPNVPFPEGTYIECFVIYLDLNSHLAKTNKQKRRAGTLVPEAFFYSLLENFSTRTASYTFFVLACIGTKR